MHKAATRNQLVANLNRLRFSHAIAYTLVGLTRRATELEVAYKPAHISKLLLDLEAEIMHPNARPRRAPTQDICSANKDQIVCKVNKQGARSLRLTCSA